MKEPILGFRGEYFFLSNFYACSIRMQDGYIYPSAEHAFQAYKTVKPTERTVIRLAKTAKEAKRKGRVVTLRENWANLKVPMMREIVTRKFEQNPELKQKLFDTGYRKLVEENYWGDQYWGVCQGAGRNYLGVILMEVRANLRLAEIDAIKPYEFPKQDASDTTK